MTCPEPASAVKSAVRVIPDIHYGWGTTTGAPKDLRVDAYLPDDDKPHVPLLVIHGGGFKSGKRTDPDIVKICHFLAERGYACFSPNYRIASDNPVLELLTLSQADDVVAQIVSALGDAGEEIAEQAYGALVATEDVHKARTFLGSAENREIYGIDAVPWGLIGQSAGGITALFTGYAGDSSKGGGYWPKNLGIGDEVGCVVAMWGALPIETILFPEVPLLMFHGTMDKLLKYAISTFILEQCARQGVRCERHSMVDVVHGHESARLFERPLGPGTYMDRVASFLTENLVRT